ncbi:TIGR02594 family protein [Caballeronia sp. GAFFF1]|uniref:TIGR02594 family protein n=1 Tax=Caballeronia sp. GAFFF1 TaxID=2921779 RepID=UPI002028358D|nr:TIGR02594 family protein [Caballeronia sp. GAFFF1]
MSYSQEDKINFIKSLYCPARQVSAEQGCSWELILAQAAQETGWGEKILPGTNNVFNIKADASWTGESTVHRVWEVTPGGATEWVNAPFRVYPSILESLRDRQSFLASQPRYKTAGLFDDDVRGDLAKEADALQKAKYATDPAYAAHIVDVFQGRTMQKAVAEAKKEGCKGCLPTINVQLLDAAKTPLASTRIKASQGTKTLTTTTDADGRAQVQAALPGGTVAISVWSDHDRKWTKVAENLVPTSPPVLLTITAPTIVVNAQTEPHRHVASEIEPARTEQPTSPSKTTESAAASTPKMQYTEYKVRKGDTLSKIARSIGTHYALIAHLNGIASPYRLFPGQVIKVPLQSGRSQASSRPHDARTTPGSSEHSNPSSSRNSEQDQPVGPQLHPHSEVHVINTTATQDHPLTEVFSSQHAPWMAVAEKEFQAGVRRRGGKQPDEHIEEYFSATSLGKQRNDKLAYCAAFVNWCLTQAGVEGNNSASAASLASWGRPTRNNQPAYGAVAVVKIGTGHHVTFVNGRTKDKRLATLGGNQGRNHGVTKSALPLSWVTDYRFPKDYVEKDEDYDLHIVGVDGSTMTYASTH